MPLSSSLPTGRCFGYSIGARGSSAGEVVFNTAMTGYQEIPTDPRTVASW
jgi:carbamoyl-phosphate synthase small subunit